MTTMKIKELQARQGNVDLKATVTNVAEPRTFDKFGKQGKVANATIKDDSGSCTLTLWNEQVDQVSVGDEVQITNGYVSEWKGDLQLGTGKFGKLDVLGKSATPPASAPAATPDQERKTVPTQESLAGDDAGDAAEDSLDVEEEEF